MQKGTDLIEILENDIQKAISLMRRDTLLIESHLESKHHGRSSCPCGRRRRGTGHGFVDEAWKAALCIFCIGVYHREAAYRSDSHTLRISHSAACHLNHLRLSLRK